MSSAPEGKTLPYTSTLGYSTDGGSTYTDLAEVVMVHPPSPTLDKASTTVLDSPGGAKEALASWIDLGTIPFECFFTKSQYNTVAAKFFAGDALYWRIKLPLIGAETNHSTFIFQGFLSKLEFSEGKAEENDAYSYSGEITISTYTGYSFTQGS